MDKNTVQGNLKELKGEIKKKWGRLTDDDVEVIEGSRDKLIGKIQQQYGMAKDKVDEQLKQLEQSCQC